MKTIILPFVFFTLTISSYGQDWQKYDLGNGVYISFPSTPKVQNIGQSKTLYGVTYKNCSFSVIVSTVDPKYLPTTKEEEISALKSIVGLQKAKGENALISEKLFSLKDHEWIEIVKQTKSPSGNEKGLMHMGAFFSNGMLYQITCLDKSENNSSASEAIALFLESIKK